MIARHAVASEKGDLLLTLDVQCKCSWSPLLTWRPELRPGDLPPQAVRNEGGMIARHAVASEKGDLLLTSDGQCKCSWSPLLTCPPALRPGGQLPAVRNEGGMVARAGGQESRQGHATNNIKTHHHAGDSKSWQGAQWFQKGGCISATGLGTGG